MTREIIIAFDALISEAILVHTPFGDVLISLFGTNKDTGAAWVQVNGSVDEVHKPVKNIVDVRLSKGPPTAEDVRPAVNTKDGFVSERSAAFKEAERLGDSAGMFHLNKTNRRRAEKIAERVGKDSDDDPGNTGC